MTAETETASTKGESPLREIKKDVSRVILLTVITFFIYYPIWFLRVRRTLNNLRSDRKIGYVLPLIVLAFQIIGLPVSIFQGISKGIGMNGRIVDLVAISYQAINFLNIGVVAALILLAFRVRRILLDHFGDGVDLSPVATFFLGIFYLQDKINRL